MQPPVASSVRDSGIDKIGALPWGTHVCQFYREKRDLLDVLVPFFRAGLRANEFCMWVTSDPLTPAAALAALREAVPDVDERVERGQLEILTYDRWYLDNGTFDFKRVLAGWSSRLEVALERGYEGMRVSGNTAWLEQSRWDDFAQYEATIHGIIGRLRMMALCTYSLDRCGANEVIDVVANHQFALVRRGNGWHAVENSERKRMAEALRRADEHREDLLRAVTHDLRTPLSVISNAAESIRRKPEAGAQRADTILRNCRSMESMLNDLTEMVGFESGTQRLERQRLPVDTFISELLKRLDGALDIGRVQLELASELPVIHVDAQHFERVLVNLLTNAMKYSEPGTEVLIKASHVGDQVVLEVKDAGQGIPADDLTGLFERFYRARSGRKAEGLGLGLYISRLIVEAHGGTIRAESEVGRGSTFTVALPASAAVA